MGEAAAVEGQGTEIVAEHLRGSLVYPAELTSRRVDVLGPWGIRLLVIAVRFALIRAGRTAGVASYVGFGQSRVLGSRGHLEEVGSSVLGRGWG